MRKPLALFAAALLAGCVLAVPSPAQADDTRSDQWYMQRLDIDKAHRITKGKGVKIGVIDSGVDATHPDLSDNVVSGNGAGHAASDGKADTIGHGTAVASVLAGHGHGAGQSDGVLGIAPEATIVPYALDWETDDDFVDRNMARAISWLASQHVDIITTSVYCPRSRAAEQEISAAVDSGIPVVTIAGNLSTKSSPAPEGNETLWPGTAPDVIPVSGITTDGSFWDGSRTLKQATAKPHRGLSGPASNIPVALPDDKYATYEGTSFAGPIVAGTLALLKSAFPQESLPKIRDRLLNTVDDRGPKGYDNEYGWGVVEPYRALTTNSKYGTAGPLDAFGNSSPLLWTLLGLAGCAAILMITSAVLVLRTQRRRPRRISARSA